MTGGGAPTEATRVAPRTGARTAVAPSGPRRLEPRPSAVDVRSRDQYARAPQSRPPERRRGRAFALFFLFAVIIVAVVAAIVISTSTAPTVVQARNIVAHDFQDAYNQLSSLIGQYTK